MPIVITLDSRRLRAYLTRFPLQFKKNVEKGLDKTARLTAQKIRVDFTGDPLGFKNRTGALRKSIQGGLIPKAIDTGGDVVAFIGAGGDNIGSNGLPTREYVARVEFAELRESFAGNVTAFLRPGALSNRSLMRKILTNELSKVIL